MCKILLVVTGASRGLGRAFSRAFTNVLKQQDSISHVHAILFSRSVDDMTITKQFMQQALKEQTNSNDLRLDVSLHYMDLSTFQKDDDTSINDIFSRYSLINQHGPKTPNSNYQKAILINNAGSTSYIGQATHLANEANTNTAFSLQSLQNDVNLNITSAFWLTSLFTKHFSPCCHECCIVNISSLCAIQPFPSMALYCAFKAAREMFFQTLAKETATDESNNIKVLNYAPGPCDTKMVEGLLYNEEHIDKDLKQGFNDLKTKGTLVLPDDTAECLANIIMKGDYTSGQHIDYYDVCNKN